jgi:mono/diheme cytochrome c family protein
MIGWLHWEASGVVTGFSLASVRRRLVHAAPVFFLLLVSGCDTTGSYPADLRYPLRTDLLVIKAEGQPSFYPDQPGQLEESINKLAELQKDDPKISVRNPQDIASKPRQALARVLQSCFGTPAKPRVQTRPSFADARTVEEYAATVRLTIPDMEAGSKLYRRHCLHCHGLTGDGRGPTGPWVQPHPRDYRRGQFKFISSSLSVADRKPRRDDLYRTLTKGLDGTSMPSFALLSEQELEQLITYVIHLSIRGEVEYWTMNQILIDPKGFPDEEAVEEVAQNQLARWVKAWSDSNVERLLEPSETPVPFDELSRDEQENSIRNGYELFSRGKSDDPKLAKGKNGAGCMECHEDFGRQVKSFRYDVWGTLIRPNNLTNGVYRGGRRPIDIYWRIKGGIMPSTMPQHDKLAEKDIWDLVNFVKALPYPAMLPTDVQKRIYPNWSGK